MATLSWAGMHRHWQVDPAVDGDYRVLVKAIDREDPERRYYVNDRRVCAGGAGEYNRQRAVRDPYRVRKPLQVEFSSHEAEEWAIVSLITHHHKINFYFLSRIPHPRMAKILAALDEFYASLRVKPAAAKQAPVEPAPAPPVESPATESSPPAR